MWIIEIKAGSIYVFLLCAVLGYCFNKDDLTTELGNFCSQTFSGKGFQKCRHVSSAELQE